MTFYLKIAKHQTTYESEENMNKQEAIEKIENLEGLTILDNTINFDSEMIPKKEVLNIANQIDEPVKPVVPQFIDTWIQGAKYNGFDLYETMTDDEIPDKVFVWIVCNPETFAKAWIYGYEVEHEQHYVVAIPDDERNKFIQLWRSKDGKLLFNFQDKIRYGEVHLLTEQEIKQKDERLWQFAEEVEDE